MGLEILWVGRLALAGLLAAAIGLERQYHYKEAGLRTHFLVGLGSAAMMIVSKYAFSDVLPRAGVELDPSRVAAQVVTGVGFIGAGTIIFRRNVVHGLTTAAGLWATSSIGLAVGAGLYVVGIAGTALILLGLGLLDHLALRLLVAKFRRLIVSVPDRPGELGRLGTALGQMGVNISNLAVSPAGEGRLEVDLHLRVPADVDLQAVLSAVESLEGVTVLYSRPGYAWPSRRRGKRRPAKDAVSTVAREGTGDVQEDDPSQGGGEGWWQPPY